MTEAEIRKYAELMKELELTGLEITEDNKVFRLERNAPQPVRETIVCEPTAVQAPVAQAVAPELAGVVVVRSPMVGRFYAAPTETDAPYVKVGDNVEQGKTLCLIEQMKMMNEIPAEICGEVVEICVENGQVVDCGTALFKIKRAV